MRQWRVGTLSMGVLLIGVGVLLLIGRLNGVASITWILKWWPIILILLGLEILGYAYFSKQESPKIMYDGFSIFIVLVIIIFSSGAYIFSSISFDNGRFGFSNGILNSYKYNSSFTKKMVIDSKGKTKLNLKDVNGNIEIKKSNSKNIEVVAEISILNNDQEYAKTISEKVIEVSETNDIMVEAKTPYYMYDKSKIHNINVNLKIKVPDNIDINAENQYGDVSASEIGRSLSIINNTNGNIDIK